MKRIYPKCLFGLLGFATLIALITRLLGFTETRSLLYLSLAGAAIVLGSIAWEVLERGLRRNPAHPSLGVWLAFPLAILLGLGALPLLVLAIYPPLEAQFIQSGRIETHVVQTAEGSRLILLFPRATRQKGNDLRLNAADLPLELTVEPESALTWKSPRELWVDLSRLPEGVGRVEQVAVNLLAGRQRFVYEDGDSVSAQVLRVRYENE